jgi:hypothetical protein
MDAKPFRAVAIGDKITYTLSASQYPTNPEREYLGVVTGIDHQAQQVLVTLLDKEYEGLSELVSRYQIRSVAKS